MLPLRAGVDGGARRNQGREGEPRCTSYLLSSSTACLLSHVRTYARTHAPAHYYKVTVTYSYHDPSGGKDGVKGTRKEVSNVCKWSACVRACVRKCVRAQVRACASA